LIAAGIARLHAMISAQLGDDIEDVVGQVSIGIETDRGPWVQALIAAGYMVFAVNPLQAARFRDRLGVLGGQERYGRRAHAGRHGAHRRPPAAPGGVTGVAAAGTGRGPILTAGVAGLVAGAVSMALGEYVSVSSQRDTERAEMNQERRELADTPQQELAELVALYRAKGLSGPTARAVAEELTRNDAFAAHLEIELGIDPKRLASPSQAASASAATGARSAHTPP
jgi:hypothetical protein